MYCDCYSAPYCTFNTYSMRANDFFPLQRRRQLSFLNLGASYYVKVEWPEKMNVVFTLVLLLIVGSTHAKPTARRSGRKTRQKTATETPVKKRATTTNYALDHSFDNGRVSWCILGLPGTCTHFRFDSFMPWCFEFAVVSAPGKISSSQLQY